MDRMDGYDCRKEIREQIGYAALCEQYGEEETDEIVELMTDVLCTTCPAVRIGGTEVPIEQVRGRFRSLNYGHLEYIFDSMRKNTTQIRNIRAYLLTTLYNAPVTISHYYQAAVQHDLIPDH